MSTRLCNILPSKVVFCRLTEVKSRKGSQYGGWGAEEDSTIGERGRKQDTKIHFSHLIQAHTGLDPSKYINDPSKSLLPFQKVNFNCLLSHRLLPWMAGTRRWIQNIKAYDLQILGLPSFHEK